MGGPIDVSWACHGRGMDPEPVLQLFYVPVTVFGQNTESVETVAAGQSQPPTAADARQDQKVPNPRHGNKRHDKNGAGPKIAQKLELENRSFTKR